MDIQHDIDTLVFDYGGVIVNLNKRQVTDALCKLGVGRIKQVVYGRRIKRLIREFIDGLVPTEVTLAQMLKLCRRGTTTDQLLDVLRKLCGDLPTSRLQALVELRKRYKVYMLSNISDVLWQMSAQQIRDLGHEPAECYDGFYLSYEMGVAKPDSRIYTQMFADAGINPQRALYFEDRIDNYNAGKALGLQAVLVETNHLEQTAEWQALMQAISQMK